MTSRPLVGLGLNCSVAGTPDEDLPEDICLDRIDRWTFFLFHPAYTGVAASIWLTGAAFEIWLIISPPDGEYRIVSIKPPMAYFIIGSTYLLGLVGILSTRRAQPSTLLRIRQCTKGRPARGRVTLRLTLYVCCVFGSLAASWESLSLNPRVWPRIIASVFTLQQLTMLVLYLWVTLREVFVFIVQYQEWLLSSYGGHQVFPNDPGARLLLQHPPADHLLSYHLKWHNVSRTPLGGLPLQLDVAVHVHMVLRSHLTAISSELGSYPGGALLLAALSGILAAYQLVNDTPAAGVYASLVGAFVTIMAVIVPVTYINFASDRLGPIALTVNALPPRTTEFAAYVSHNAAYFRMGGVAITRPILTGIFISLTLSGMTIATRQVLLTRASG